MRNKTKSLAISALLTSLIVVLIIVSGFFPTLSLTIVAISGLIPMIAVVESGYRASLEIYFSASVLSLILSPDKSNALLFIVLFGHYPIIKSIIERLKNPRLEWLLKIITASVLFGVLYILFNLVIRNEILQTELSSPIIWVIYIIAFVLYDISATKLITIYSTRRKR